jgi:preprotein translocase subunit YajC
MRLEWEIMTLLIIVGGGMIRFFAAMPQRAKQKGREQWL